MATFGIMPSVFEGWINTAATVTSNTTAYTTTNTTNTTTIWNNWFQLAGGQIGGQARVGQVMTPADEQHYRDQHAETTKRRDAAVNRARELLEEHLTPRQLTMYRKHGWFVVQGGKSGKRYVIHTSGIAGNIHELGDNNISNIRYCCHANDNEMPAADHWLTQKLWIESCEDEFLAKANKSISTPWLFAEAA